MIAARYDMEIVNFLKDVLSKTHNKQTSTDIKEDVIRLLTDVDNAEILLILHELRCGDYGITTKDVKWFLTFFNDICGRSLNYIDPHLEDWHPVRVFQAENQALKRVLEKLNHLMNVIAQNEKLLDDENTINELQTQVGQLGQFINHYNRKEKIFFPILERYGQFSLTRLMWGDDDRIRNLYKGTKSMVERLPDLDFEYIKQTFDLFEDSFKEMIFHESTFLLPVVLSIFQDKDWIAIATESDAYGYALIDPNEWKSNYDATIKAEQQITENEELMKKQLRFGGGFLTLKEADTILNNLPVEITFVDKFGVFKYFNNMVEASEMMFVRTPSSIGRNVGDCHPPKSMKKITKLIRDLQLKRREYECMWFKKDGRYVHITYKGLFDKEGEYLGILEYVQDIQPFLDLPREVKKELRDLDE